ncbi:MAG: radical SAM protein [Verrucomicrobiales bacterium]|nr:radical SAM protein [Verrucomicrobiales bacterium]
MMTSVRVLKTTTSVCPECRERIPADVVSVEAEGRDRVYLRKNCPTDGTSEVMISSDARFYYLSKGAGESSCGSGCGCAMPAVGDRIGFLGRNATIDLPPKDPTPFHTLSTCLALIEIVDSCNLACPTCFADSPVGIGDKIKCYPLEDITGRIQGVIDRKGKIEILQLSGGEPTLHPEFFELLTWCHGNPGIDYVLVNSNGVKLAKDPAFGEKLKGHMDYGHFQFYLQFDGPGEGGEKELRGGDLRALKVQAIERAGELGIPLTLAMTVIPENLGQLWETVAFGLKYEHCRGVSFQPMFGSGRGETNNQLNTADIILGLVGQSGEVLSFDDFTPLPCGDPNCATIGYLLKLNGEVKSISDFVDFKTLQGFIGDRVRYRLEDLEQCGCESEPLGELLHELEMDERATFRLFIKPFMDADNWDQDRIDRCCTHVIRPDGVLDSFCRYYLNGGASVYQPAT